MTRQAWLIVGRDDCSVWRRTPIRRPALRSSTSLIPRGRRRKSERKAGQFVTGWRLRGRLSAARRGEQRHGFDSEDHIERVARHPLQQAGAHSVQCARVEGWRRRPSGTALSSPDSAVPWRARRRRDCDPGRLRPASVSLSPTLSHADCRTTSHAIHSRQKRLFTFHIIAVSGEATLHADHVYVQACQPATGHDTGLMFRTCRGRKDYYGGPNNFASLDLLNRPEDLARRIEEVCRI